jgi:hypothetical protein
MPWVEKRRNGWIVRSQKDGKVTSRYFDDESEARYYARMGKPSQSRQPGSSTNCKSRRESRARSGHRSWATTRSK